MPVSRAGACVAVDMSIRLSLRTARFDGARTLPAVKRKAARKRAAKVALRLSQCASAGEFSVRRRSASAVNDVPAKTKFTPTAKPRNHTAEVGHCIHSSTPSTIESTPAKAAHPYPGSCDHKAEMNRNVPV